MALKLCLVIAEFIPLASLRLILQKKVAPENRQCHLSDNAFVTILHEFQIGQLKQNV